MPAADPVRLVRASDRRRDDAPTPGMTRERAIASEKIWAGVVRTAPRASSAWHHHGAYETAIYVLSGRTRMESRPGGRELLDALAGDFFHVPPGAVHRETNPDAEEAVLVVVRSGSGPATVNVDAPAS